jgi:excisionase family DNA binding protein
MAGMFYSLREAAKKLNKTADEVKKLVEQGKLREFRDGPNQLFKIDEVEALISEAGMGLPGQGPASAAEQPIELDEDEILLVPETSEGSAIDMGDIDSELSEADTATTGEGLDIIGETSGEHQLTDDTVVEATGTGSVGADLTGAIDEDVNLDSFGSGSGLLDLSLQADDTSLGGILDEIYTPEGAEGEGPPDASSAAEMAAEADTILPEEDFAPAATATDAAVLAHAYVEPEPDTESNVFGVLLFLPLLAIVYTAIIVVLGQKGAIPSILQTVEGVIWYIIIGAIAITAGAVVAAFWLGNRGPTTARKPKKAKKPKKPKKAKGAALPGPEEETPA